MWWAHCVVSNRVDYRHRWDYVVGSLRRLQSCRLSSSQGLYGGLIASSPIVSIIVIAGMMWWAHCVVSNRVDYRHRRDYVVGSLRRLQSCRLSSSLGLCGGLIASSPIVSIIVIAGIMWWAHCVVTNRVDYRHRWDDVVGSLRRLQSCRLSSSQGLCGGLTASSPIVSIIVIAGIMWWAHCVVSNRVDYRHRRDYVVGSLRRLQSCRLSSSQGLCGGLIASSPIVSIIVIAGMMWWAHCVVSNRVDYRHRRDYVVGSLRRLQSCRLSSSLGLCGGLIASSPIVSIIVIAGIMWWAHCVVSNRVDYRHRSDYVVGSLRRLQSCRLSSSLGLCGGLIASSPIVSIIVIAGIMWWAHCVVSNRVDYLHRRDYVVGSLRRLQSCRLSSSLG